MAVYSNFVCFNQIFASKGGLLGKKVVFYSKWRSNQEWPFIGVDTVIQITYLSSDNGKGLDLKRKILKYLIILQ